MIATMKHRVICIENIGIRGNVYPRMQSLAVIGEVKSLGMKESGQSQEIVVPEKS